MIPVVSIPLLTDNRPEPPAGPAAITHSEMTQLIPSGSARVPFSDCPGEMIESPEARALASQLGDGRGRRASVSELWHCRLCGYTVHLERDPRGVRRIRNGYPRPSFPDHPSQPSQPEASE